MVAAGELVANKRKVKVVAGTMEQLVEAIADKLQLAPTFTVCVWESDFEEFVPASDLSEVPLKAQVQLQSAAASDGEAEAETTVVGDLPSARGDGAARVGGGHDGETEGDGVAA